MAEKGYDIDIGGWFRTLLQSWWLVIGLVVLGALAGAVITLAQPDEYTATASVYIGQTTDANGNPMAGLNSNAKAATQLLASEDVLGEASEAVDVSTARLRAAVAVETPSQVVKTTSSIVNIVVINVTLTDPESAAAAANALAQGLLARIGDGVDQKIALLERQIAGLQQQIEEAARRGRRADAALLAITAGGGTAAERAAASAPYVAVAQAAASERESLETSLQRSQLLLLTAKNVEQPRLLHEASVPRSPSGPQLTMNVAAGALAGFVIGVIAAFIRPRLRTP
jgi:uncharacterized protein involved in exopolysaccharide biosynthesis